MDILEHLNTDHHDKESEQLFLDFMLTLTSEHQYFFEGQSLPNVASHFILLPNLKGKTPSYSLRCFSEYDLPDGVREKVIAKYKELFCKDGKYHIIG